jgi:hypothetical protein
MPCQQKPRTGGEQRPAAIHHAHDDQEGCGKQRHLRQCRMDGRDELREERAEEEQHLRVSQRNGRGNMARSGTRALARTSVRSIGGARHCR